MKQLALYTALRVAVLAVVFGVLFLVFGGRVSIWAVALLAIVVTGVVSLVAFRRQAAKAGVEMSAIVRRVGDRYASLRASEDIDDDEDLDATRRGGSGSS